MNNARLFLLLVLSLDFCKQVTLEKDEIRVARTLDFISNFVRN